MKRTNQPPSLRLSSLRISAKRVLSVMTDRKIGWNRGIKKSPVPRIVFEHCNYAVFVNNLGLGFLIFWQTLAWLLRLNSYENKTHFVAIFRGSSHIP